MLYGFQPYAFYRNVEHVNLTFPFIPFLALLCLRVAGTRTGDEDGRERAVSMAACVAQGFSYVYYTFFACLLLVAAGAIGWLRTGRSAPARRATVAIVILTGCTVITIAPSVLYWQVHGPNRFLEYKFARETDKFGMKLRHLLVPITDHPVAPLREAALAVERADFPDENENVSARLGGVGAIGLVALLLFVLGRAAGLLPGRDDALDAAAALTLLVLLVSTVGGLASLFSVFVSPDIGPTTASWSSCPSTACSSRAPSSSAPSTAPRSFRVSRLRWAGWHSWGSSSPDCSTRYRCCTSLRSAPTRRSASRRTAPSCARSSRACRRARWCSSCHT